MHRIMNIKILYFFRLNTINEGRVAIGDMSGFLPCTPNGCIELIKKYVENFFFSFQLTIPYVFHSKGHNMIIKKK